MKVELTSISRIQSPYTQSVSTPIQPRWAAGIRGTVEVFPEFTLGLRDLDGFDRAWLVYWFDRAWAAQLAVVPYLDTQSRGIFATRAPSRPNAIGLSRVQPLAVDGNRLQVADLDVLDSTPLLDIKPFIPDYDVFPAERVGWYAQARGTGKADERFEIGAVKTG